MALLFPFLFLFCFSLSGVENSPNTSVDSFSFTLTSLPLSALNPSPNPNLSPSLISPKGSQHNLQNPESDILLSPPPTCPLRDLLVAHPRPASHLTPKPSCAASSRHESRRFGADLVVAVAVLLVGLRLRPESVGIKATRTPNQGDGVGGWVWLVRDGGAGRRGGDGEGGAYDEEVLRHKA